MDPNVFMKGEFSYKRKWEIQAWKRGYDPSRRSHSTVFWFNHMSCPETSSLTPKVERMSMNEVEFFFKRCLGILARGMHRIG